MSTVVAFSALYIALAVALLEPISVLTVPSHVSIFMRMGMTLFFAMGSFSACRCFTNSDSNSFTSLSDRQPLISDGVLVVTHVLLAAFHILLVGFVTEFLMSRFNSEYIHRWVDVYSYMMLWPILQITMVCVTLVAMRCFGDHADLGGSRPGLGELIWKSVKRGFMLCLPGLACSAICLLVMTNGVPITRSKSTSESIKWAALIVAQLTKAVFMFGLQKFYVKCMSSVPLSFVELHMLSIEATLMYSVRFMAQAQTTLLSVCLASVLTSVGELAVQFSRIMFSAVQLDEWETSLSTNLNQLSPRASDQREEMINVQRRKLEVKEIGTVNGFTLDIVVTVIGSFATVRFRHSKVVVGFGNSISWSDLPILLAVQIIPEILADWILVSAMLNVGLRVRHFKKSVRSPRAQGGRAAAILAPLCWAICLGLHRPA